MSYCSYCPWQTNNQSAMINHVQTSHGNIIHTKPPVIPNPSQQPSEAEDLDLKIATIINVVCHKFESPNFDSFQSTVEARTELKALFHQHLATEVEEAKKLAYKQGWDSAGGELADTKGQIEEVLERLEANAVIPVNSPHSVMYVSLSAIHQEREKLKGGNTV